MEIIKNVEGIVDVKFEQNDTLEEIASVLSHHNVFDLIRMMEVLYNTEEQGFEFRF